MAVWLEDMEPTITFDSRRAGLEDVDAIAAAHGFDPFNRCAVLRGANGERLGRSRTRQL
jgi:hypothetical protein